MLLKSKCDSVHVPDFARTHLKCRIKSVLFRGLDRMADCRAIQPEVAVMLFTGLLQIVSISQHLAS